jgi:hypothetical protein
MTDENAQAKAAGSEYIAVYRARSAARFFPNEGLGMTVSSPQLPLGPVRFRSITRWVGEEPLSLPRELIVEARGPAASLDDARPGPRPCDSDGCIPPLQWLQRGNIPIRRSGQMPSNRPQG